jgi:hypothetical protein
MTATLESKPEVRRGLSSAEHRFPPWLLNTGFVFALAVAAACLILSSWYLFTFLKATNAAIEGLLQNAQQNPNLPTTVTQLGIVARTVMARFALLSCGVSVGMGFGFLGFALFLVGIKGEMDVEAQKENAQIKIARMAPGVFVIMCAVILIAICITFRTEYDFKGQESIQSVPQDLPVPRPSPDKP